jgi:hypothetical protein
LKERYPWDNLQLDDSDRVTEKISKRGKSWQYIKKAENGRR